ncbi:MAG: type II toxin-antitoxin system VapC family toxin [Actinomycetales bacterium]
MVVIDTSALLGVLLEDEESVDLDEEILLSEDLIAPDLLAYEVVSAMVKGVRRGRLGGQDGLRVIEQCLSMVRLLPPRIDSSLFAANVAQLTGLSGYDASYLCLAHELQAPLLTLDQRLRQVAQTVGVDVVRPTTS